VLDDLARYVERGYALVRLKPGTNVPVNRDWTVYPLTSWPAVAAAWTAMPDANVGVATGRPSGIWALDVDPRHDGHFRMDELVAANGPLPRTYTTRTPGGGVHLWWRMTPGVDVRNGNRLPRGVDVRGTGGQIAVPPSVRPDGVYTLLDGAEPVYAPDWLLDLVRYVEPERQQIVAGPALVPALTGQAELDRVRRYALSAATAEIGRLAGAQPGERNATAFAVACNLNELINATWGGLAPNEVWQHYAAAGASTGLPMAELDDVWGKAVRRVAGQARAYPRLDDVSWSPPPGLLPDPTSPAVPGDEVALTGMRARALDVNDLYTLPGPEPLIEGYLWRDSLAWIIGQSGRGKTFVMLDMALCIATGLAWHGHAVKTGRVLYLLAEGSWGADARVRAWAAAHNGGQLPARGALTIYPDAVQAGNLAQWTELVEWVAEDRFDLVVLDTQARMTVGMEENSATDMGIWVERAEWLRRAGGGCVSVVHHQGHAAGHGRGSSALPGAATTELSVSREGDRVIITTTKQKDAPELDPLTLRAVETAWSRLTPSGVLVAGTPSLALVDYSAAIEAQSDAEVRAADGRALLVACFVEVFVEGHGATKAECRGEYERRGGARTTFYRAWGWAIESGRLAKVEGRDSYLWVSFE
jgi:hypothetical protein